MESQEKGSVDVTKYPKSALVTVSGRFDSSNSAKLDETFKQIAEEGKHSQAINLTAVDYMSSAGLRAIVSAFRNSQKNNGKVNLVKPSKNMSEVLELAGLDTLFIVYEKNEDAVGNL